MHYPCSRRFFASTATRGQASRLSARPQGWARAAFIISSRVVRRRWQTLCCPRSMAGLRITAPLQKASRPEDAISAMFDSVDEYFWSGRRVCLVGALALGDTRDRFASEVRSYFSRWVDALSGALIRSKRNSAAARALAEEVVAGIQGAIVLARALDDPRAFSRALERMRDRLEKP